MAKPPLTSARWTSTQRSNAVIVIIAMSVMTVMMWNSAGLARDAQRWPAVEGVVVSAHVAGGGKGGYRPEIAYQYTVEGVGYSSDRYTLGTMSFGGESGSAAIVAAHPPGTPVRVYYDPRNPAQATLQREGTVAPNLLLALLTATAAMVTGYFRFVRREPETAQARWARLRLRTSAGTRR